MVQGLCPELEVVRGASGGDGPRSGAFIQRKQYQQRVVAFDDLLPDVSSPTFEALTTGAAQPFL